MHGGPNIEFGLHVHNMCETNADTLGREKCLRKKVVGCKRRSPQMVEIGHTLPKLLLAVDWAEGRE